LEGLIRVEKDTSPQGFTIFLFSGHRYTYLCFHICLNMDSKRQRDNPQGEPTNSVLSGINSSRRSARKAVFLPIWLRNEEQRPIWEEETEAQVVSRYGAGLSCRHFVQAQNVVIVLRRDNGQRAKARVTHVRYDPDGKRQVGIEFIDKDNFWDLDWGSAKPVES
jgi:hypothetical protein